MLDRLCLYKEGIKSLLEISQLSCSKLLRSALAYKNPQSGFRLMLLDCFSLRSARPGSQKKKNDIRLIPSVNLPSVTVTHPFGCMAHSGLVSDVWASGADLEGGREAPPF